MSRIPAHSVVVASTTISAVVALCLLGGLAAEVPANAAAATTTHAVSITTGSVLASRALTNTNSMNSASTNSVNAADTATPSAATPSVLTTRALSTNAAATGVQQVTPFLVSSDIASQFDATASAGLLDLAATQTVGAVQAPPAVAVPVAAAPAPAVVVQTRSSVLPVVTGTPRQMAQTLALSHGWSPQQWTCLDSLWQRESKFETTIRNTRSGAYGIPQALPASRMKSAGADWKSNPVTQIQWGMSYISSRYGSACNAWAHWKRSGWY